MSYGSNRPVLGRKFCKTCGRWRHLVDFSVQRKTKRGVPLEWESRCKACKRMALRAMPDEQRQVKRHRQRMWYRLRRMAKGENIEPVERVPDEINSRIDNTVFRERYLQLLAEKPERPTTSIVAQRMGFTQRTRNGRERVDSSRLERILGIRPEVKNGKQYMRQSVSYETAVKLAEALEMDPHEAGV